MGDRLGLEDSQEDMGLHKMCLLDLTWGPSRASLFRRLLKQIMGLANKTGYVKAFDPREKSD